MTEINKEIPLFEYEPYHNYRLIRALLFLFILLSSIIQVQAQNPDSVIVQKLFQHVYQLVTQGNYRQADLVADSIIEHHEHILLNETTIASDVYNLGLTAKQRIAGVDEVRKLWQHANHQLNQQDPVDYDGLARIYMTYAAMFNVGLQMDSIYFYLNPVEELLVNVEPESYSFIQFYYQKGRLAYNNFDYETQVSYLLRGLNHIDLYYPEHHLARISYCNAIGIGFRNQNQYEEAIKYLKIGLATPAENTPSKLMHASIYNNLGLAYSDQGKYNECIECISNSLEQYQAYTSNFISEIGSGFDNLGRCYKRAGKIPEAKEYFRKSLQFMQTYLPENHRDYILPYLSLGSIKIDEHEVDSAELFFQFAKQTLIANGWTREDPGGNYIVEDPFDVFSGMLSLYKSQYEIDQDTTYLYKALDVMEDFIATTNDAFQKLNTVNSIENYFRRYESTYTNALECLYQLHNLNTTEKEELKALEWIEKFKAMELRYAYRRAEVKFSPVHEALNRGHEALMDSLRYFENLSYDEQADPDSILQLVIQARVKLQAWKERTRFSNPEYYNLIYQQELPAYDFENILADEESVVLFKLGDNCLYTIVADRDSSYFIKSAFPDSLHTCIDRWRNSIIEFGTTSKYDDRRAVALLNINNTYARLLYESIMRPIVDKLKPHLVIIPDGVLGYIPFGALLTNKVDDELKIKDYPYFIKTNSIGFSYSLALYKEMNEREARPQKTMLSVAPQFDQSAGGEFSRLHFNELEAASISKLFNGKLLAAQEATKSEFVRRVPEYQLVHLATHGKASDQQQNRSFLAYSVDTSGESKLYTGDIYNLSLQAELVSLSACETGLGKLSRSEGIISLARAFSFAGAKSVLSTLWQVNDKSTSNIMTDVYRQLKKGYSKRDALQRSTLNYIQSCTQAEAHPYYWSAFLTIGDQNAIQLHSKWKPWHLLVISLILIAFYFLLKKMF